MAFEATWNGEVIAHSDRTVVLEGNPYFPFGDVNLPLPGKSATTGECPWQGTAHCDTLAPDGKRNVYAAWSSPDPRPEARKVRDKIAFRNGVEVVAG